MEAGTLGTYDGSFFNKLDSEIEVSEACNLLHLRAVVQDFNMEFANRMRKFGHKYNVDERPQHDTGSSSIVPAKWGVVRLAKKKKNSVAFPELQGHYKSDDCDGNFAAFQDPAVPVPVRLTHAEAIEWVLIKLRRSRGRELPGIFNPELIGHLFQEQSNKWKTIAQDHIDRVALSCKDFVAEVLSYVALEDVKTKLLVLTIENALKSAHGLATAELKRIIDDKMRHPITYNHYFTDSLQKMQRNKHAAWVNEAMKVGEEDEFSFDQSDDKLNRLIDRSKLQKAMDESLEQNMDRWSAEQALDAQTAYYKVTALTHFP
jgi:hypothetical protein